MRRGGAGSRLRSALLAAPLAVALLGPPLAASAHALAQSSTPAAGAILQQAPAQVSITFGETPDPRLSSITVLGTDGKTYQQGAANPVQGDPKTLVIQLKALPKGVYTVSWRTFSAVDGHVAAGSFAFGVGVIPPAGLPAPAPASTLPSAPTVLARTLLLAGLTLALGAAFASVWVLGSATPAAKRLLALGSGLSIIGTWAVLWVQARDAGVPVGRLIDTSLGTAYVERLATLAALVGGAAAAARASGSRMRGAALWTAMAGAAAAMLVDASTSHAAAGDAPVLNVALQWVHLVAVGVWIGGLVALLASLRGLTSEARAGAARRFSDAALIALLVVAGSGVARAAFELGGWDPLLRTGYGLLIVVKVALILVLAVLGAVNKLRNVPAAGRAIGGLARAGSAEVVVAAAAIVVASALVNMAPPVSAQARQQAQQSLTASGQDFGGTVAARLTVTPGTAGFNRFVGVLTDPLTHRPIDAELVTLTFSLTARPDLGRSTLELKRSAPGIYTADGGNLSLNGGWGLTLLVQRGARSADIHLDVTPTCPPPTIDRAAAPGQPTIYTAHVCGGDSVQVYLDPGTAGTDQFHATFFDPSGNELDTESVTLTMTPTGGRGGPLTPRRLDSGHFVADATVSAGTYRFDVAGTTPAGESVSARFDISVTP